MTSSSSGVARRPWRRARWLVVLGAGVLMPLIALRAARDDAAAVEGASSPAPTGPSSDTTQQLRAELDELRARVAVLAQRSPDVSSLGPAPAATPAMSEDALSPEELEAADAERAERQVAVLEQTMATDPRDAMWSPQAERSIHDAFATANVVGARLEATTCSSTMCRIRVRFDSAAARDRGTEAILRLVTWDTVGVARRDPDDSLRFAVYAAREPGGFPQVD